VLLDSLNGSERQFASDARDLVYRSRAAATALTQTIGDETRRTIGEADITAYNASYSLPCRTQIPRVVYWLPTSQIALGEEVVVDLHGNFLNFGTDAKVLVDGRPAASFTRSDRVISVRLPREYIQKVTEKSSVPIVVSGLSKRVLEPHTLSWIFGCGETVQPVPNSSVTVVLIPRVSYRIKGEAWASYKEWSEPFQYQSGQLSQEDDNCDADREIGFQSCVSDPENMRVVRGEGDLVSKSGPSAWRTPVVSGTTCINFPALLKGSGYDRFPFGVKNCKGHAWLTVNWRAFAQRHDLKETQHLQFDTKLSIGTYSYNINDAQSPKGDEWKWRFVVQIDQMRGSEIIQSESLSEGRFDNGNGWAAHMLDGVLTVTLPSNID
jgi:hypothetical protein